MTRRPVPVTTIHGEVELITLSVRIPATLHKEVKVYSVERRVPMMQLVAEALARYVSRDR